MTETGPYPEVAPGPPRPSRILRPGLGALAPGVERYQVPGGGAILVSLEAGDRIEIRSDEGGQPCEILVADPAGRLDPALLGAPAREAARARAEGLMALLSGPDPALARLRRGLAARGIDPAGPALRLFGTAGRAGERGCFDVTGPGQAVIAAPGGPMDPWSQATLTPLTVFVTRRVPRRTGRAALPEPLADPVLDLRIPSASARAYRVKAGDYFQIIDVDGRQCTDFQCFDARKLDRGIAHPLDVTTTRTLMGHGYPMPGLHAKYYDHDMVPLVEVIRDTCGRHDAFALACSAKYYDDIGYPGHVNCTDNFNAALAPHGIDGRAGWMAANFFFNTGIDAHGVMYADEPWSRPGDYVMLRALTDIVCVSSACPDDTSPANGWNPTDIHVRAYSGAERFSRAVALRPTPDAEPRMTKESAFHRCFARHTRDFVEYRGYWLPNSFSGAGPLGEYHACREAAVVMDLSALRKFEITGPDAESLLNYALTRNIRRLDIGQVVYTAMCHPHGGMIDDGTLMRLDRDNFRWIGGEDYGGIWLRELAREHGFDALVRASSDQMHNIAVQGPRSREILSDIIWTPPHRPALAELQWFRLTIGRIGDETGVPVVVSRTGYTGELGYEIWCHPRDAETVFDAVWTAGTPRGMLPMGLAALDMVRIEAGLIFAGHDFSDRTDPFEAGIGFTVPLKSKTEDFVGRAALIRRKEHPSRRMVGLEIDAAVAACHGDPVCLGRAEVGEITSAMRSPILGKSIALARVDVTCSELGTALEIGRLDGQQQRLPARVVPFAHYDPQKTRPRS